MFCKNCGEQITDGALFCTNCGASVAEPPVQPAQQPVAPAYQQPVYQQPVYQQPGYQQPVSNSGRGMGVAALVMGIVSCCLFWIPYVNTVCLLMCIAGIILSAISMKKARAAGVSSGIAVAGLVVSIVGLVLSFLFFFIYGAAIGMLYPTRYWY